MLPMRSRARLIIAVCCTITASCLVGACSTIHNGSSESVLIVASPMDAEISVDGEHTGVGMIGLSLKRGTLHEIEVSRAGYRSARLRTGHTIAPDYWANLILLGAPGMLIDLLSSAAVGIDPNPIHIGLIPGSGPPDERVNQSDGYLGAGIVCGVLMAVEVALVLVIARGYN